MAADVIARGLASGARGAAQDAASAASAACSAAAAAQAAAATALAGAAAKSAGTTALIAAIRNNGFFPQPLGRAPAADIPTFSLSTAYGTSTLNGRTYGNPLIPLTNTAKINFLGGVGAAGGGGGWYARGAWYGANLGVNGFGGFAFTHVGSAIEIGIAAGGQTVRVIVADRIAASYTLPADGAWYQLKLTFPSAATRHIRIEVPGGSAFGLNPASVSDVPNTTRSYPIYTFLGDSFTEGTTGTLFGMDNQVPSLVRALGGHCPHGGVGATGLLNPGPAGSGKVAFTDANRLKDLTMAGVTDAITGAAPNVAAGILFMSINDGSALTGGSTTAFKTAMSGAVWTILDAWAAAQPGKPLFVFGPTAANSTPATSLNDLYLARDAGQEAVWGARGANAWFIDRFSPALPLLRQGVPTSASDQSDLYTDTDNVHPNPAGHAHDALWMANAMRRVIMTKLA